MAKLLDIARMTTPTIGIVSPLALGFAVPGFNDFDDAGAQDGDLLAYGIADGANSEIGEGIYNATAKTLTRVVKASTNDGNPIALSGTAQIFITANTDSLVTSVAGRNGDVLLALADITDASANGRALVAANYAAMKALLALDQVNNTSDANKPVSSAQQAALNLKANLVSPALTGTPTTPNNAGSDNSTKIANTAYVDAAVAVLAGVLSGALVFKGAWDASAGTFPGAGAAQTGWFYKVSVAGTVNGIPFAVGDDIYAVVNSASTSTYAANWLKVQGGITLAEIQTAVGFSFGSLAALSTITASLISDASANGRSLITAANYAAMLTLLGAAAVATTLAGYGITNAETLGLTAASNVQTASYQLALTDIGKPVRMNVASANNLTVPANATVAFPIDTYVNVEQYGAGLTTIVAAAGVTIRVRAGLNMGGQYALATLHKIGTDEWILGGDVSA